MIPFLVFFASLGYIIAALLKKVPVNRALEVLAVLGLVGSGVLFFLMWSFSGRGIGGL